MGNSGSAEERKTKQNSEYVKLLRDMQRKMLIPYEENEERLVRVESHSSEESWVSLFKKILSHISEVDYPWRPYMRKALSRLSHISAYSYRSGIYWTLYGCKNKHQRNITTELWKKLGNDVLSIKTINNYKTIAKKVHTDLLDLQHPFTIVKEQFQVYVEEQFVKGDPLRRNFEKDILDVVQTICLVLLRFYGLTIAINDARAEMFLPPTIDLIIQDNIYDLLQKRINEECKNQTSLLKNKLEKFENISLSQLHANEYFCFDTKFRSTFHIVEDSGMIHSNFLRHSLEALKAFPSSKYISQKLKLFPKIGKAIRKDVTAFWNGFDVDPGKLVVDPDSLLSLIIYLIVQSKYPEIGLDLKMAEIFVSEAERNSDKGYYLVTFRIALDWLLEQDPKSFIRDIRLQDSILALERKRSSLYNPNTEINMFASLLLINEEEKEALPRLSHSPPSLMGSLLLADKKIYKEAVRSAYMKDRKKAKTITQRHTYYK